MKCDHEMSPWRPVPDTTDCLVRQCYKCGTKDLRILPPVRERPREERGWWNWYSEGEE